MFNMFHVLVTIFTKSDVLIKPLFSKAATAFSLNKSYASLTFCFSKLFGYSAAYDSLVSFKQDSFSSLKILMISGNFAKWKTCVSGLINCSVCVFSVTKLFQIFFKQ